jgi:hypothetical protein
VKKTLIVLIIMVTTANHRNDMPNLGTYTAKPAFDALCENEKENDRRPMKIHTDVVPKGFWPPLPEAGIVSISLSIYLAFEL